MFDKKLQAGLLPTVLVICFIFALLISSLILFSYSYRLLSTKQRIINELSLNARSGLNFALANPQLSFYSDYKFDLFGEGKDSITLLKKYWGLYDLTVSSAHRGKNKYQELALIGSTIDSIASSALYLLDENRPLTIVGKTKVQGNVFLPEAGVKAGFIQPDFYQGNELIYGKIYKSSSRLPRINASFYDRFKYYQSCEWEKQSLKYLQVEEIPKKSINHSFVRPELIFRNRYPIILKNISLKGNIIIYSNSEITVENTALLEDAIIIAPKVVLKPGFKGQLQIFASDSVEIGEGSLLTYPSTITVVSSSGAYLNLKNNCSVAGLITIVKGSEISETNQKNNNRLNIEEEAIVYGNIYNDGLVQLKGNIFGNIICQRFYLQTPITLYENYLHNITIDVNQRSKYFLSSSLLSSSNKRDVIQWLK